MRHIVFKQSDQFDVALLFKSGAFIESELRTNYITPLVDRGLAEDSLIAFTLKYGDNNKASATLIKEYLSHLLPGLVNLGVKHLYVTDAAYFKVLAGQSKADPHYGYALPCKVKGFEHLTVVLGLNYQQLIYNPQLQPKLDLSLDTLASKIQGTYSAIGTGIIHSAHYPSSIAEIGVALIGLLERPVLTCDIEAFSLQHDKAGIGTIAFAWSQHEGIAFACDYHSYLDRPDEGYYGYFQPNEEVRDTLRRFFEKYEGKLIFHNASYDVKVLIATLWMENLLDTEGLLTGLEVLTRHFHDTKIIAYLATNSTAGNVLGLKALAHEFAGNWAVEVTDIRKVPLDKLLQYNLVDALCTQFVFNKYYSVMVQDQQLELYESLMLPSQKLIIQLELTGMPLDEERVTVVKAELVAIQATHLQTILSSPLIQTVTELLQDLAWTKDFEDRRSKAKKPENIKLKDRSAFDDTAFNPNSGLQLQKLLYQCMDLPVLDTTDTGQPATGADTLEKLVNHTTEVSHKRLLEALISYSQVTKILSTFIPAFEAGIKKEDESLWLHGSFNLGGTVSGRLSSSDPNLQNLPAGNSDNRSKAYLGKLIKKCFSAPQGWIFAGADFNSLEDYISALTTKDPNKLAVYERGFDGHCLRASFYFRDQLLHIDQEDPASVNSLKKTHPELRQKSKGPTFALTYQGTSHTLMNTLGFPEDVAKAIEHGYHELYKVSDQYVQNCLKQASKDGYVTVAFGLRIRTPLLAQVVFGARGMPYEAAAEGRTAGNALGQSYGLLNNRAAVAFFKRVWKSPYRLDILPVALIHDAIYILIRDRIDVVEWANKTLIEEMRWQELPEIQHPSVKLGAALDLYWPDWSNAITLPNEANRATIIEICKKAIDEVSCKKAA